MIDTLGLLPLRRRPRSPAEHEQPLLADRPAHTARFQPRVSGRIWRSTGSREMAPAAGRVCQGALTLERVHRSEGPTTPPFRRYDLRQGWVPGVELMIRKAAYEVALGNIARWGETDVFPKPLDNHVLADMPDEFLLLLRDVDKGFASEVGVRPPAKVTAATPNGYSGFRWATQLDPMWNAYLLALVLHIAAPIEAARVPPESVFSHRVDLRFPENRLFREDGYTEYTRRSTRTC